MDSRQYIELEDRYGAHNYHPLDVVVAKAKGIWVWDVEGRKYLDFLSSYSAVNQGHCHPRLIKTVQAQVKRLTLTSRAFRNDQWPLLAAELCEITGYEVVLPMNSGAEAVETAIKTARKWAYLVKKVPHDEAEIIACANNFHGRTVTIVSFSTERLYRDDFGPFTPGFTVIPFGDPRALEAAINPRTAALLIEPIQAEAGILIPPAGFLKEAAEICRRNNVLFIADEIQTGLGRTGKLFDSEYEGVRPDMVVIGKSLGGGFYPLAAGRLWASSSPGSTARPSAATPWPAPWPARPCALSARKRWSRTPPSRAPGSWNSSKRSAAVTSKRSAAGGCSSESSSSPKREAPAASASHSRTRGSCARKPTTTSSVSRRRSSSDAKTSTGP